MRYDYGRRTDRRAQLAQPRHVRLELSAKGVELDHGEVRESGTLVSLTDLGARFSSSTFGVDLGVGVGVADTRVVAQVTSTGYRARVGHGGARRRFLGRLLSTFRSRLITIDISASF